MFACPSTSCPTPVILYQERPRSWRTRGGSRTYPSADRAGLPGRLSCAVLDRSLAKGCPKYWKPVACPAQVLQAREIPWLHRLKLLGKAMRAVALAIGFQNRPRHCSAFDVPFFQNKLNGRLWGWGVMDRGQRGNILTGFYVGNSFLTCDCSR